MWRGLVCPPGPPGGFVIRARKIIPPAPCDIQKKRWRPWDIPHHVANVQGTVIRFGLYHPKKERKERDPLDSHQVGLNVVLPEFESQVSNLKEFWILPSRQPPVNFGTLEYLNVKMSNHSNENLPLQPCPRDVLGFILRCSPHDVCPTRRAKGGLVYVAGIFLDFPFFPFEHGQCHCKGIVDLALEEREEGDSFA